MSYFLPRKAGLMRPCGRAVPWRNTPCERFFQALFNYSPAELVWNCICNASTLTGGVWQRLLRSRVRIPSGAKVPVAQWIEQRATFRRRLFPGQTFNRRCRWARLNIHLGRWCRSRILLKPKRAGSNPARNASSSSSVVERRKNPLPLVPRSKFP